MNLTNTKRFYNVIVIYSFLAHKSSGHLYVPKFVHDTSLLDVNSIVSLIKAIPNQLTILTSSFTLVC